MRRKVLNQRYFVKIGQKFAHTKQWQVKIINHIKNFENIQLPQSVSLEPNSLEAKVDKFPSVPELENFEMVFKPSQLRL